MATTRIISMHVSHGKTIADCLTDRIDYSKNPDKTQGGELISAYECDPKTADAEFLYSKRQYQTVTGREQRHDVIAYQVRQSFKPGEITPEEANRVGYEFAERFLKGRHAFFVATHTDKKHIHNHIIWNSTALDCKHKFRDFLGSGRAVARLSDAICTEHRLSVITNPKRGVNHYGRWLGNKAKPSHRELLCGLIDAALLQKPDSFDTLLKLLAEAGCEVRRRGNTLSLRHPDKKGFVRLSSIDGYCCGLRPAEARLLRNENVDLVRGVLYIEESKGHKDRTVVVADDLLQLMRRYAEKVAAIYPDCPFFFPRYDGMGAYSKVWAVETFWRCFQMGGLTQFDGPRPRVYDFRHTFATECICRWMREGKDVDAMLPFLSAYMGHARFEDTAYYIHMVPDFYQRTGKLDVSAYETLLPEVYHEDQE